MWRLLILLGLIGGNNPIVAQPTHYPVAVGMQWTYQRFDPNRATFDTVVVRVVDHQLDTFYCAVVGKYFAKTMKIIKDGDSITYWLPNEWPIVLYDGTTGDQWHHGKDCYEILSDGPLAVLDHTYSAIQTYRFGLQEAMYWAGDNVGLIKIFYGYRDIWNLISYKYYVPIIPKEKK